MAMDSWQGKIDNELVPRLLNDKNGNYIGISTNGISGSMGSEVAEYSEGQYINQIAWDRNWFTYKKWNGQSWENVSRENAFDLYRKKDEFINQNSPESLKFKAYSTTPEPIGKSIRYPTDVSTGSNSDYVLFDFFDYQPPFRGNATMDDELPDALKASDTVGFWTVNKGKNIRLYTNEFLAQYNRTGTSADLYKRDTSGSYPQIMLYMPDDISDTLKADWQGKAFGSTTAGLLSASAADGNIEKIKSLSNLTGGTIKRAPVELAASLVTNLAKGITGDTINTGDIFGGISGAIRNPNVEVLFQKMNLRTFDLTFKLVPYDIDESNKIKKIIKVFKKSMLPTYSIGDTKVLDTKGSENAAVEASFIKVPKVCKVTYMRGSKQHPDLPTYKMCAITDIGINYTPDGNYAVYKDGSPVAYELKINFMETKLLFSEEIDTGEDMSDSYAVKRWEYGDSD